MIAISLVFDRMNCTVLSTISSQSEAAQGKPYYGPNRPELNSTDYKI